MQEYSPSEWLENGESGTKITTLYSPDRLLYYRVGGICNSNVYRCSGRDNELFRCLYRLCSICIKINLALKRKFKICV
jgi:hypothetical protein